jgi:hypothetical protein
MSTTLIALLIVCAFMTSSFCEEHNMEIPKEIQSLVGSYHGEWAAYGVDSVGQIIKTTSWVDTITLSDPVIESNRVYAYTEDKMYFNGGLVPPMKVSGIEGYFLNDDGSLGDYFFEIYGQVYRMHELNNNTWVYAMPGSPQEMANFGFTDIISAQHVVVKVVAQEDGTEMHRITRISTVNWKDKDGRKRWIQYTSLEGFHKRMH